MQSFPLATFHEPNAISHFMHRNRGPLPIQVLQLTHDFRCCSYCRSLSINLKILAPAGKTTIKIIYQNLQIFIPVTQERICFFTISKNYFFFQNILQTKIPPLLHIQFYSKARKCQILLQNPLR